MVNRSRPSQFLIFRGCQGQMQFSLICHVLVQQCLTEVIRTIPVLMWDSVKRSPSLLRLELLHRCQG